MWRGNEDTPITADIKLIDYINEPADSVLDYILKHHLSYAIAKGFLDN
jgi:hypothetical protein